MSNDNQTQKNETLTAIDQAKQELEIVAATNATNYMNPVIWKQMDAMSRVFIQSGAMPAHLKNAAQVMVVLQAGQEIGLKPMESLNSIYIVKGSVNLWGRAVTKRYREHGYKIEYAHGENDCTATVTRGKESYSYTYTFDEAEQSGYTKDYNGNLKPGWLPGLNRKLKLSYGALNVIAKLYTPEVLGSAEGIAEVIEDAQITEAEEPKTQAAEAKIVKGGESSSLSDFMKQRKAAKTEQKPTETEQESTETEQKPTKKDEKPTPKAEPAEEKSPEWKKLQRVYFATIKEMNIDHDDVKEMEGFESLNDLNLDKLKDLVGRLKS